MAFNDLPPQPPINPRADAYAIKALELSQAVASSTRTLMDVAYGSDYWQRLDIYMPADLKQAKLPVHITLHGGGWSAGYKEWMGFGAPVITSLPAIFVSVSYRLAPGHQYPTPVEDCFRALRWVHDNIAKLGGDPDRITIGGHSAGAHLSALVAVHHEMGARFGLKANVIKACFPYSGTYDFNWKPAEGASPNREFVLRFIGKPEAATTSSPITYIKGNKVPFYVCWAGKDNVTIRTTSQLFVDALKKEPAPAEGYEFTDFDHFEIHLDQQRAENRWVQTVTEWMRKY